MTNDEITRLKEAAEKLASKDVRTMVANPAAIIALLDRLKKAEEALKPFARSRRVFDKTEPVLPDGHAYNLTWNMDEGRCDFTLGQFRRARNYMEKYK